MAAQQTYTATEMNPLKGVHVGVNYVRSKVILTGGTVSDVFLLARLPNKATLIWWGLSGGSVGNTSGVFSVGFQGTVVDTVRGLTYTANSLAVGVSLTASNFVCSGGGPINQANGLLPLRVSISDDNAQQFAWIQASAAGTLSTSLSLVFSMLYVVGEGSGE